jgi:hypothetical protein
MVFMIPMPPTTRPDDGEARGEDVEVAPRLPCLLQQLCGATTAVIIDLPVRHVERLAQRPQRRQHVVGRAHLGNELRDGAGSGANASSAPSASTMALS